VSAETGEIAIQVLQVALRATGLVFVAAALLALITLALASMYAAIGGLSEVARGKLRPIAVLGTALAIAALIATATPRPESWPLRLGIHAGALALGMVLARLATRHLPIRRLAIALTVPLALAGGVYLGFTDAGIATTAVAAIGVVALALVRRHWRHGTVSRDLGSYGLGAFVGLALGSGMSALSGLPGETTRTIGVLLVLSFVVFVVYGLLPLAIAAGCSGFRSLETFVVLRYFGGRAQLNLRSLVPLIAVISVATAVCIVIVVDAAIGGFGTEVRDQLVTYQGHLTIASFERIEHHGELLDQIRETPGVETAAPILQVSAIARAGQTATGALILGIDPSFPFKGTMVKGSAELDGGEPGADPPILVGEELAQRLHLEPGATLVVASPKGGPESPGGFAARMRRFRVAGVYRIGTVYAEMIAYTRIEAAQELLGVGDVADEILVWTHDPEDSLRVGADLASRIDPTFTVRDWRQRNRSLFAAVQGNRSLLLLVLGSLILVSGLVIGAVLILGVHSRVSSIGILKAMGASERAIGRIFTFYGMLVGLLGVVVGIPSGVVISGRLPWIQQRVEDFFGFDVLPAGVYAVDRLQGEIEPERIALIALWSVLVAIGASYYPSFHAANLDPVDALRSRE
jgi:lipoprotein-releasing system permease protein